MDEEQKVNGGAERKKYWNELSAEEKIDRMREVIKRMERQLQTANGEVRNLQRELKNHRHLDGDVVYRAGDVDNLRHNTCGDMLVNDPSKIYF